MIPFLQLNLEAFVQYGAVGLFLAFLVFLGLIAKLVAPIVQKAMELASNHLTDLAAIIDTRLSEMIKGTTELKESIDSLRDNIEKWQNKEHPTA